ncbi:hypothetical protein [Rhodovastum atsumiense]|uniref:hypothetical protein n=1 Tax=Rhodovastum atsumiense TaxID=504468 RepID=UPI0020256B52|nr:hypothetical protein [Rhodovastum atsumiense]
MSTLHELIDQTLRQHLDASALLSEKLNTVLRLLCKYRATLIQNTLIQHCGLAVLDGPFQGMQFVSHSAEGCHVPKLLGCYEAELHAHILAAVGRGYEVVINIGAAEGYYAVGLARLMPATIVYAYDSNIAARQMCQDLAEHNGVAERVSIGGVFQGEDFARFIGRKALVLCDIEGSETDLLDPRRYPVLQGMDIIVELHDTPQAKPSKEIPDRFRATHAITMIRQGGRSVKLPRFFETLGHLDQLLAVWEWRSGPTPWAVMLGREVA